MLADVSRRASIILAPGRERALLRRHPWLLSNAIARVEGDPSPGETVEVHGAGGEWLARGAWSPRSQIRVRVWTFDREEELDGGFFGRRLELASEARRSLFPAEGPVGYRLVHGESDGIPGFVADRYAGWIVCQFTSAGAERWRDTILEQLVRVAEPAGVWERSDADVRGREGLEARAGRLAGAEPPERIEIRENRCRFLVDVRRGHKTGFYLDQRDNRAKLGGYARGARVLNGFAYTGAFGVAALRAGASRVTNVESSAEALGLAADHAALNGIDPAAVEQVQGDVFQVLRRFRAEERRFDLVILDPPRFADSRAAVPRACRGYKDINLLAFQLLRPGGVLFTFSCSGLLEPALFQKVVADAALDAGREARIEHRLAQAPDHPTLLAFPEASYLKGLVCRA